MELERFEGGSCDNALGLVVPVSCDVEKEGKLPVVSLAGRHRTEKWVGRAGLLTRVC